MAMFAVFRASILSHMSARCKEQRHAVCGAWGECFDCRNCKCRSS